MSAYKIVKLGNRFDLVKRIISDHIENDIVWEPATSRTPNAVWSDISGILDHGVRSILADELGRSLHDIFWICDYRECRTLEIHMDNPGNEYPINSRFIMILMVKGRFEVSIWNDDQKTLIESVIVNPGEMIILNNSQYYHSGLALDSEKVSLHGYPIIPEIDDMENSAEKFEVERYI